MNNDLSKQDLYESVKTLLEDQNKFIHLPQVKLYSLFSICFQYMLYCSTKEEGIYLIRFENHQLASKVAKKAKDINSRNFMSRLLLPRKLNYGRSTFLIDFFHPGSWITTRKDFSLKKLKAVLVVKNTSDTPFDELEYELPPMPDEVKEFYYLANLIDIAPKLISIAYDKNYPNATQIKFPFIKDKEDTISGLKLDPAIKLEELD